MSEWDATPWGGTPVAQKAVTGPLEGWYQAGAVPLSATRRSPQRIMREAQALYWTNPWIRKAESTVTSKVVGLPWHLEDGDGEDDEEVDEKSDPRLQAIRDLLEQPEAATTLGRKRTRRGMLSLISRHMGLCGVAYVFNDQPDTNGIPTSLIYVNPARVWASEDRQGNLIGWVLDAKDDAGRGGLPLRVEELTPFYLEEPDWGFYPMGLVEVAALKARVTGQADGYASNFLANAGRLGGFVSPKQGVLGETDYRQLQLDMRGIAEQAEIKRLTVLRGPLDYTETGADPTRLALTEIATMNRDDIYAIWGVPPSQSGVTGQRVGMNSGETRRYEYQVLMQGAVHDRVVAIHEPLQYQILDRWKPLGLNPELIVEEPEFEDEAPKFEMAAKAREMPLKNRERRELIGLEPFGDERDEEVWLPSTMVVAYEASGQPPAPPPEPEIHRPSLGRARRRPSRTSRRRRLPPPRRPPASRSPRCAMPCSSATSRCCGRRPRRYSPSSGPRQPSAS
jgi:phage portal protein BeeE